MIPPGSCPYLMNLLSIYMSDYKPWIVAHDMLTLYKFVKDLRGQSLHRSQIVGTIPAVNIESRVIFSSIALVVEQCNTEWHFYLDQNIPNQSIPIRLYLVQ